MEIIVGKTAGFCYGVKNAVKGCIDAIKEYKKDVYCLGEIAHNPDVIKSLEEKGVNFIENIEESKGITIIRAHGVPKNIYQIAKKKGIVLKDYTCPNVIKIHKIAEEYEKKGYYIFLCGSKSHPEIIGTLSYCGQNVSVINNEEKDVFKAIQEFGKSNIKKALLISQTTYSLEKFYIIEEILKNELTKDVGFVVNNTICRATELRQIETKDIAKKVSYMIIIGGKNSSNTHKLYEVAKKECGNSICIENKNELDLEEIKKHEKVGIMAGASTPQSSIEEVINAIEKI